MNTLTETVLEASQPTFNLSLVLATLWIINNDFAKYTTSSLTIAQYAKKQSSRLYHNDLIDEIIKRAMIKPNIKVYTEGDIADIVLDTQDDYNSQRENYKRDKFVCFLDSLTSYKNFERDLLNPSYHYHRNGVFLFIYTGTEQERLNNVKEIFRRMFYFYCTNINVLLMVGRSPYLYTYFPFSQNKCHSSMPEFYISFRDIQKNFSAFQVNKPIFPSKVKNMHGCELAVVTWQYAPYIFVDLDPITKEFKRLHGIEGSLLSLLAEKMNFKIRLKTPEPLERGDVYANGTATGAAKMITDAEANITIISLMYNNIRAEVMLPSFGYLYIPYVLAIPVGPKMSSFQRLIKPFRYIIWSCLSSSIIFGILFIYYIRFLGKTKLMDFIFGKANRIPFTNLIAVLLGITVHGNFPQKTFARYILLVFLFYTFVLRTAYSGALYILLQDGRARSTMKSLSEVVQNNYTIYAFPAVLDIIHRAVPGVKTDLVNLKNPTTALFERISSSSKEKIALCLLEYSIIAYNQNNPSRRVEILEQPLVTIPVVFYMPRNSYIKQRSDELIMRILSAGLIKRFESYYLYSSRQSQHKQKEPLKLSFTLLFALFCTYAVFHILSFVIFLLELASKRSDWCRILIDFLNI